MDVIRGCTVNGKEKSFVAALTVVHQQAIQLSLNHQGSSPIHDSLI